MKDLVLNKYLWLIAGGMILFSFSCTDLSEVSFDEIPEESFFQTPEDVQRALVPVYSEMRGLYFGWHGNFDLQNETADILITPAKSRGWFDGGTYIRLHKHDYNDSQNQPRQVWNRAFTGINNANRLLFQIENADFEVLNREGLLAEVTAMRSFYHMILLDNFRNVPIIDRFDVPDDFQAEQAPPEETFAFIESGLKDNLDFLSEETGISTHGRMTRWAALATLAELYLNAEVYIGTPMWEDVVEMTDEIINSGRFILESDYSAPFVVNNENSDELVFAIPFDNDLANQFQLVQKTLHPANQRSFDLQVEPWNGMGAQPSFIDTYDPDDIRLEKTWISGVQLSSSGDTLLASQDDSLAGKPLVFVNRMQSVEMSAENSMFRIGKYEWERGGVAGSSNDYPVYRYASILMMKAEALLRLGNAAEAAELVNQVRARAFDPPEPVSAAELSATTEIYGVQVPYGRMLMELGWEFAAEARRRADLIRFGVYSEGAWGPGDKQPSPEFKQIFAIPDNVLNTNSNLEQNPGY